MRVTGLLYDLIAGRRRTVPPSSYIPAAEALYQFPSLKPVDSKGDSLKGCLVVYDGQQNDTRMNIAIALTAVSRACQLDCFGRVCWPMQSIFLHAA
jgi:glycerol-3-phosphate dehydrogenase